jgi:hypothetical protein
MFAFGFDEDQVRVASLSINIVLFCFVLFLFCFISNEQKLNDDENDEQVNCDDNPTPASPALVSAPRRIVQVRFIYIDNGFCFENNRVATHLVGVNHRAWSCRKMPLKS